MKTRRKSYKKGVRGPVVAAGDPPVGQQHVAGREIQGLSSALAMEESERAKGATSDTEAEEIAPSDADSRGATATAVGPPDLTNVTSLGSLSLDRGPATGPSNMTSRLCECF